MTTTGQVIGMKLATSLHDGSVAERTRGESRLRRSLAAAGKGESQVVVTTPSDARIVSLPAIIESSQVKSVRISEVNSWRHRTVGVDPLGSMPMSVPEKACSSFDDLPSAVASTTRTSPTLVLATTGAVTPKSLLVISQATENPDEKSEERACEGCACPE